MTKQAVKIAVDSPADLPADWRKKWDIAVIPAFVVFGTESFPDDGATLSPAQFYKRLADSPKLPTTAAPPSVMAEEILTQHLADADEVIVFTVSKEFSSLYNSIRLAAGRVDPNRVEVVDSGSVSMGIGWQALAAAEVAARGGSRAECLAAAQGVRDRISFYAALDTLEYLRRGGRISGIVAGLGAILQIKPIFEVRDGKVDPVQRVRTMSKGIQALIDNTRKNAPLERIAIMHANAPQLAEQVKTQLQDILPTGSNDNFMVSEITTAIGTHVGPGCVGVIAVKQG